MVVSHAIQKLYPRYRGGGRYHPLSFRLYPDLYTRHKTRDRDRDRDSGVRDRDRDSGVRDRDETPGPRQFETVQNE